MEHDLAQTIAQHEGDVLLLLAAFDGVLAEYQGDPAAVRVPARRLALLNRLQRIPGIVVGVISGRLLDDLRPRAPLDEEAFFVGLHGLEIVGPGFSSENKEAIETYRDRMADVARRLQHIVGRVPGVRLEQKGPIVALHTRGAAPNDVVWSRFQLLSAAADLVNSGSVRALRGQDVLELLPNVGESRAAAVHSIEECISLRYQRPVFTLYIGADWPDDDLAKVTDPTHVSAIVGRCRPAHYHLGSPDGVDALLTELIARRAA